MAEQFKPRNVKVESIQELRLRAHYPPKESDRILRGSDVVTFLENLVRIEPGNNNDLERLGMIYLTDGNKFPLLCHFQEDSVLEQIGYGDKIRVDKSTYHAAGFPNVDEVLMVEEYRKQ